jgi:hypothetical protein
MDPLTTYTHHLELSIANFQTLQITTAPAKTFSSLLCLRQLFPDNNF